MANAEKTFAVKTTQESSLARHYNDITTFSNLKQNSTNFKSF